MTVTTGIRADAHRVANLYRQSFGEAAKSLARGRVIAAMQAAGVEVVVDLWGGGGSAAELVRAGFRVIAVDDGSMTIRDNDHVVSTHRKRRALTVSGLEGGYETFWGSVADALKAHPEATGAYLDFCGPWCKDAREAVIAARRLDCVAVTLTPDHDKSTGATSGHEREMAYQLFLKMAWAPRPRWAAMQANGHVRRLLDYRRPNGVSVYLYLLSHRWLTVPTLTDAQRFVTRPDKRVARRAYQRARYASLSPDERRRLYDKKARLGPKTLVCPECATEFVSINARRACSKDCGDKIHYRQARARLLRMRAAVFGTAAEAISNEVAA